MHERTLSTGGLCLTSQSSSSWNCGVDPGDRPTGRPRFLPARNWGLETGCSPPKLPEGPGAPWAGDASLCGTAFIGFQKPIYCMYYTIFFLKET